MLLSSSRLGNVTFKCVFIFKLTSPRWCSIKQVLPKNMLLSIYKMKHMPSLPKARGGWSIIIHKEKKKKRLARSIRPRTAVSRYLVTRKRKGRGRRRAPEAAAAGGGGRGGEGGGGEGSKDLANASVVQQPQSRKKKKFFFPTARSSGWSLSLQCAASVSAETAKLRGALTCAGPRRCKRTTRGAR